MLLNYKFTKFTQHIFLYASTYTSINIAMKNAFTLPEMYDVGYYCFHHYCYHCWGIVFFALTAETEVNYHVLPLDLFSFAETGVVAVVVSALIVVVVVFVVVFVFVSEEVVVASDEDVMEATAEPASATE